jgi:hypothetical protein
MFIQIDDALLSRAQALAQQQGKAVEQVVADAVLLYLQVQELDPDFRDRIEQHMLEHEWLLKQLETR